MSRNRYFTQKEGLRKEGCFSRNKDFHTKGTFYHITTGSKHLPMSYILCKRKVYEIGNQRRSAALQKENFLTKGTLYHITTGAKQLSLSF